MNAPLRKAIAELSWAWADLQSVLAELEDERASEWDLLGRLNRLRTAADMSVLVVGRELNERADDD